MKENQPTARRYDREFKENAVALVRGGRTLVSVARDLGVTTWSLARWVQAAKAGQAQREPKTLAAESEKQRERRRLRQENDYPRQPRDILKKASGLFVRGSALTRYTRMDSMKDEPPVAALAEALEVSPGGFRAHQRKAPGQRQQQDSEWSAAIGPIFAASRQTYGCPRVTAALRQGGPRCGKSRVARLMRANRLVPGQKRKRWQPATTDSNHPRPVAENWLAKMPAPAQPDPARMADITSIDTGEGWLYLAGLLDACTRRLVGWQAGETLAAALVTQAWQKAVRDRRPGPGLLHHSDRGVQYASTAMAALLAEQGAAASMSRRGNCYDKAMMESFRATLKAGCFAGERPATRQAAKLQIFADVEGFYNRTRLHSGIGYQSSLAFENNLRYSKN